MTKTTVCNPEQVRGGREEQNRSLWLQGHVLRVYSVWQDPCEYGTVLSLDQ